MTFKEALAAAHRINGYMLMPDASGQEHAYDVTPSFGAYDRARDMANRLGVPVAICEVFDTDAWPITAYGDNGFIEPTLH